MGNYSVGMKLFHNETHIFHTVVCYNFDKLMHFIGIEQEIAQCVLKGHKHMKLLKNSRAQYTQRHQPAGLSFSLLAETILPAFGAVGAQIRHLKIILPVFNVFNNLVFFGDNGNGGRLIFGKGNVCTEAVIGIAALNPVPAQKAKNRVIGIESVKTVMPSENALATLPV